MQSTIKTFALVFSLAFSFVITQSEAAKFYKWVDDAGNIHYADKAPDDIETAEPIHVSGQKTSKTEHSLPAFEVKEKEELTPEQQAQNEEKEKNLQEYCQSVSTNIRQLQDGGRIQTVDKKGERKFLNEEEQQAKLKSYQGKFNERCPEN